METRLTSGEWGDRVILPSLSSSEGTVDFSHIVDALLAVGAGYLHDLQVMHPNQWSPNW
jgi:hypothetical protein